MRTSSYSKILLFLESLINILLVATYVFKLESVSIKRRRLKERRELLILGNGPSLTVDIDQLLILSKNRDVLAVNSFAVSAYFMLLKPRYYVIADSGWFEENKCVRVDGLKGELLEALSDKLTWRMTILIPKKYRKSSFAKALRRIHNVYLEYYNNRPIIGGLRHHSAALLALGLANPHYSNVLVACVYFGVELGYSRIFIAGADHSWHENISLDMSNSIVRTEDHFYANEEPVKVKFPNYSMSRQFADLSRVFRVYEILLLYAEKRRVDLVNISSKTYIDAFPRFTIKNNDKI